MRNSSSPLGNLGNASKFTHCHCFGLKSPWISPALSASPDTAASASLLWEFSGSVLLVGRCHLCSWHPIRSHHTQQLFWSQSQSPTLGKSRLFKVPSKWIILDLMEKNTVCRWQVTVPKKAFRTHVFCIQHVQQLHIWEIGYRGTARRRLFEPKGWRRFFSGLVLLVIHGDSWWFMVIPLKTLAIFPIGQIGQPTRHWTVFSSVGPWIVPQNVFCSLAKPYRVQQNKKAKKLRAKHGHKARVAQKMGQWISESLETFPMGH